MSTELMQIYQRRRQISAPDDFAHETAGRLWQKKGAIKHRKQLTAAEITSIIYCELVQLMSRKDNAHHHNTKPAIVSRLVREAKRSNSFIDRQFMKEDSRQKLIDCLRQEF